MLDHVCSRRHLTKLPANMLVGRFAICVLVSLALIPAQSGAGERDAGGVFLGNGQPARLAFVSAHKGRPVGGKETIKLVFTEKDHSRDEQPELKALFGDYGSALVVAIQPDGKVVTCDIRHEAHTQKPISSPDAVKMSSFKSERGQISGKLAGKGEAFGQTWEVDLPFNTKAP